MEPVSMNDGLDVRETIAFGLGTAELGVAVLALLSAYAALRLGLPGPLGWAVAGLLAGGGAGLAWGQAAGRPLLEWAVLLVRFGLRNRGEAVVRMRGRVAAGLAVAGRWRRDRPVTTLSVALRGHGVAGAAPAEPPRAADDGLTAHAPQLAVLPAGAITVAPRRNGAPERSWVVAFFSLSGGSGRTTLATELATLLAVRAGAVRASGGTAAGAALVDLTRRNPAVALRLGIPLTAPAAAGCERSPSVVHDSGLDVVAGPAPELPATALAAWARTTLGAAESFGAGTVVVDIDCDFAEPCVSVLQRCDQVFITITPTAGGALDAYRSTAALRRMGLRDRIAYIVSRAHERVDVTEVMDDLGGRVVTVVAEDPAFADAELRHRPAVLDGGASVTGPLSELAAFVDDAALGAGAPRSERWGGRAG